MADNVAITAGAGTSIASDDISSVQYQRIKLIHGADGVNAGDVSTANPLPIGFSDSAPATVNITTVDLVSGTASGANSQGIVTGTPTANSAASFALTSVDSIKVQVTGTWTGTLVPEQSIDGGTTWAVSGIHQTGTAYTVASFTANFIGGCNVSGVTHFRIRATAAMTGTATVKVVASANANSIYVANGLNLQDAVVATRKLVIDTNGAASAQPTFGGVAATAGNGASGTSVQRVTIANDSTGILAKVTEITGGGIAHDGVDSGNPLKLGARAIAHGTNPTAVAAADRTDLFANRAGIPFFIGGHPNIVTVKHTTVTTAVTDAAVITVAAGLKIVVTSFMFTLDNASTVFPTVLLGFGTANTPTTTKVIGAHGGVPAGGGFGRGDGSGIIGIGADDEDLRLTTTGNATGNGLQLVVTYFTIES